MAIAFVQEVAHKAASPAANTMVIPVTNATTAGNLLILSVSQTNFNVSGISDTKGNTWTIDKAQNSGAVSVLIASTGQDVAALTTSDSITVTFLGSVSRAAATIHEFSGCDITGNRVDQVALGTFTTTTARAAGTTPATTNANDLVWGAFGVNGVESSFTGGAGYTTPTTDFYAAASGASIEIEYQIVSATGAQSPTGTGGLSASGGGATVAYKAAAAGGGSPTHRSLKVGFTKLEV